MLCCAAKDGWRTFGRPEHRRRPPAARSALPFAVDVAANNVYLARRNLVFGLIFVRSRLWAALQVIPQNSDSCR